MPFVPDKPVSRFVPDAPDSKGPSGRGAVASPGRAAREQAFAETDAANARIAEQHAERGYDWPRDAVRDTGRALTGVARGAIGLGTMVEQAVLPAVGRKLGVENPKGPFTAYAEATRQPELAPRNTTDEFADRVYEGAGGVLTGRAAAEQLVKTGGPVATRVGQTLLDMPGREAVATVTAAGAGQAAHEAGAGPTLDALASVAGGAAAFAGPRPNGTPIPNPRPAGDAAAQARQIGIRLTPDAVATQQQLDAPLGVRPDMPPGRLRASFAGPEGEHAIVVENQKLADNLARRELGVAGEGAISDEMLARAAHPHNAAFNAVARLLPRLTVDEPLARALESIGALRRDNPWLQNSPAVETLRAQMTGVEGSTTQQALDAIRELRRESRLLYQSLDDPKKHQAAAAYREAADALEEGIERQAAAAGQPEIVNSLRTARTALAKIHNIEAALVGGPGNQHIDAQVLVRMRNNGKAPLTGWLGELAESAANFPQLVRSVVGKDNPTPATTGMLTNLGYLGRRALGERLIPGLMGDEFQNRFGEFQPGYDPNAGSPFPARQPQFEEPIPNMGPQRDFDAMADQLEFAPGPTGGADFTPTQLPPPDVPGLGLADELAPPDFLPGGNPGGLELEPVLPTVDEVGPFRPQYGAPEFAPVQDGAPALQPGASVGMADELVPELDPAGTANPYPAGAGVGETVNLGGRNPRAGGRDTRAENLRTQEPGAETLPNSINDILATLFDGGPTPSVERLPPQLQALRDELDGVPPQPSLAGLADELGIDLNAIGPQPGMNPGTLRRRDVPDIELADEMLALPAPEQAPLVARGPYVARSAGEFDEMGLTPGTVRAQQRPLEGEVLPAGEGPQPQGERSIAAELEIEDVPAAPKARDLTDDVMDAISSSGPKATQTIPGLEMRVTDLGNGRVRLHAGKSGAMRKVELEVGDDALTIRAHRNDDSLKGKGFGQQNYVEAAKYAQSVGKRLDSDISYTRDAWRAVKSALDKGLIEADDVPVAAIEAALEAGGGVAKNPSGKPWITGIRVGPAS